MRGTYSTFIIHDLMLILVVFLRRLNLIRLLPLNRRLALLLLTLLLAASDFSLTSVCPYFVFYPCLKPLQYIRIKKRTRQTLL